MEVSDSLVWQEIESQPDVWSATLRHLQANREAISGLLFAGCWDEVFFTGSGSSHYLALAAANLYQQLAGTRTRGVPSAEIVLFPRGVYPDILQQQNLLVAVSRSGETTETLQAVEQQMERRQPTLAITCHPDSPLAARANMALSLPEAAERAVPQTRSFSSIYLSTQYLAGLAADDAAYLDVLHQLPEQGRDLLAQVTPQIERLARQDWERIIILGSGAYYGLACEGALKIKEMSQGWCEAYHWLEFRHGPLALVDERTLVVGLLSDTAIASETSVLSDVRALGAQTMVIGEQPLNPDLAGEDVVLQSGLPELARGPLCLMPLQMLALQRAVARGLDPDRPRHLHQAVLLTTP